MILVIAPIDQRTRIKDKTTSPSDNAWCNDSRDKTKKDCLRSAILQQD